MLKLKILNKNYNPEMTIIVSSSVKKLIPKYLIVR